MTKLIAILICFSLMLPGVGTTYAADSALQDNVIKSFEPLSAKIVGFFARNPKLLTKVSYPEDPLQVAFSITHFQMDKSSSDIKTTDSILYPYVGYVDIDTQLADNKPCGNVSFMKTVKEGWSSIDEAIKNANNAACFVIRTPMIGVIRNRFVFQYHAKKGRWVFSEITYPDGAINSRFMALLGVPSPWCPVITEPKAQEFNKDWLLLFRSL